MRGNAWQRGFGGCWRKSERDKHRGMTSIVLGGDLVSVIKFSEN